MKGYKGMIHDRIIPMWNLALLWCKVKGLWIDIVYDEHVRNIDNKRKSEVVKFITGHKNKDGIRIPFMATISNDDCFKANDPENYEFWKAVDTWINWFSRYTLYMRDDIDNLAEEQFREKWNIDTKLYKFIYKYKHLL